MFFYFTYFLFSFFAKLISGKKLNYLYQLSLYVTCSFLLSDFGFLFVFTQYKFKIKLQYNFVCEVLTRFLLDQLFWFFSFYDSRINIFRALVRRKQIVIAPNKTNFER